MSKVKTSTRKKRPWNHDHGKNVCSKHTNESDEIVFKQHESSQDTQHCTEMRLLSTPQEPHGYDSWSFPTTKFHLPTAMTLWTALWQSCGVHSYLTGYLQDSGLGKDSCVYSNWGLRCSIHGSNVLRSSATPRVHGQPPTFYRRAKLQNYIKGSENQAPEGSDMCRK